MIMYLLWWGSYTLKKRDRVISTVNARYHNRTHTFGFEVPKDAKTATKLDIVNGNTCWQDAIAKEIKSMTITFKILYGDDRSPPCHR